MKRKFKFHASYFKDLKIDSDTSILWIFSLAISYKKEAQRI